MRIIGSRNFSSPLINKLHSSLKPVCTLLQNDISFEWAPKVDIRFKEIKTLLSKEAQLAIPKTSHPFNLTVEASLIGLDTILFQPNTIIKKQLISYISCTLNTQEQKF